MTCTQGGREGGVVTCAQGGGREVLSPGPGGEEEGGVVTCAQGEGGREVLSPGPGGGREVLSPAWGGGRCCDLCRGGEGGVVTRSLVHSFLPPAVEVTHACENITFVRFATRAVMIRPV